MWKTIITHRYEHANGTIEIHEEKLPQMVGGGTIFIFDVYGHFYKGRGARPTLDEAKRDSLKALMGLLPKRAEAHS